MQLVNVFVNASYSLMGWVVYVVPANCFCSLAELSYLLGCISYDAIVGLTK